MAKAKPTSVTEYNSNMDDHWTSLRKTARLTGLLYLIFALVAMFTFMYISPKIIIRGDAVATAQNMIDHEFLFRAGLAGALITHTLFLIVALLLYRLLRNVNEHWAKLMVGLVLIGIPVAFLGNVMDLTALNIFKGKLLQTLPPEQAQDMAMTLIRIGSTSGALVAVYWGLWLIPLGILVYRSGFIPRVLGILLWINGIGYIINAFTYVLFPDALSAVSKVIFPTYFIGEIPLILWLLIKGVSKPKEVTPA